MSQEQEQILKFLHEELVRIRLKNPNYSLRAFSKKLGIAASALSGILNGRLPITRKSGEKILHSLSKDPKTMSQILQGLKLRDDDKPSSPVLKAATYSELDMDQFHLISEWYYFGILSLATTKTFKSDSTWIAKSLGIQKREANAALERLERLGLLARDQKNKLVATGKAFKTSSEIPNTYLRKHHLQGLDLARRAMEEDEFKACDFSSITMAVDPEKLPEAKKLITQFRQNLCAFMVADAKKEVYRMSVQLFPLSNRESFSKLNKK